MKFYLSVRTKLKINKVSHGHFDYVFFIIFGNLKKEKYLQNFIFNLFFQN
jgi:hypothetical protein